MTQLTSMCEMACQIVQKNLEEKQLEEEQAAKAQCWKLPVCYDDDDDEEVQILWKIILYLNFLHEFTKSCVENLVPNLSESEGENGCNVLACFTTFSNVLFDDDYDSESTDDQSLSDEDVPEKIYSNPLFDEEIIPIEIDQHSFNAEYDLIESMPNHDSSVIISLKIDSLFDEFAGELTLLKSFPPGIDETDCQPEKEIRFAKRLLYDNSSPRPPEETVSDNSNIDSLLDEFAGELIFLKSILPGIDEADCDPEEEIRLIEKLLYDNSSPRPLEEFNSENSDAIIESFSPSLILIEDIDSLMEEIDLFLTPDDSMPPGNEDDDYDSEGDILFLDNCLEMIPLHFLNMSHFILMFHHPLVLLRNR
nr:hypothetical protein [Tanacetum cinerariifolium]